MKELGIKAHYVKPWTTTMRNSNYDRQLRNSLKEEFNPSQSNTAWCIDTTYIRVKNHFVYLTSIMALYSRKIIGWKLTDSLEVANVIPLIERTKQ